MSNDYYVESWPYESFISMATGLPEYKHGHRNSEMQALILKENDKSSVQISIGVLMLDVKKAMLDATKKAIKRPIKPEHKLAMQELTDRIEVAASSFQLLDVCKTGIEIMRPYKKD